MPHLISNLVEKSFTPYTARLAPRNLWNYPTLRKSNSSFEYGMCSGVHINFFCYVYLLI
jgi:hypothetical protein